MTVSNLINGLIVLAGAFALGALCSWGLGKIVLMLIDK